jgi:hypothetical protein
MTPRPEPIDPNTEAARRILDSIEAHYQPTHRYVNADPAAFAHLDLGWYDRVTRIFEGYGFRHLADIEDKTITEAPNTVLRPTFLRALVSRDGTVTTALYDPRIKGLGLRLLLWLLRKTPKPVVDCETECTDGSFVGTSNGMGASAMQLPSLISAGWLPAGTKPEDVYATHTARVTAHLKARPGVRAVVIRTREEMLQSQDRQNAIKAAFRGEIGGLTTAELEKLSLFGTGNVPAVRAALDEEQARRRQG